LGGAKDLLIKPIDRKTADALVERVHYSGKTVKNSQLHLGVYYNGILEGAMQFGPSLDKRKIIGLVEGTPWNGFIELNRMAFTENLPKNSESRAIAVAARLFKSKAKHIQWIISFADATQCGDGTIYRASGFWLTGIKENTSMIIMPNGDVVADIAMKNGKKLQLKYDFKKGAENINQLCARIGAYPLEGFQIRYILPLAPDVRERLTVPILPYSALDDAGARMYLGQRVGSARSSAPADQAGDGGASPTPTLSGTP
jgi:hypothetical protein